VLLFLGVDSHKDSLAACLVDQTGAQLAAATFLNTPDGHGDLLAWLGLSGQLTRAGIEGAANLGAGMARLLHQQGLDVREVPCTLTVRERRRLRRPGKSDPTDALAIARITAREHDLPPARHAGQAEDLKVLSDYRDELVAQRTAEANRLHADLAIVCAGYARHCRALSSAHALNTATGLLEPAAATAGSGSVRAQLAQRRIVRLRQLDEQIAACLTQLTKLVAATRTQLVDIVGIGPLLAARILGEVGDIQRFPTRDHFASANGTAPIPVSSGRTDRHRLNRGGNRRLNRALYFAALTQASHDPRARAYLARKQAEGKTRREALRCLKRRLSDVVYKALLAGPKRPEQADESPDTTAT
jgi:transposase